MADHRVTRRDFVRDTGLLAAGVALSVAATKTVHAGNPAGADTSKILNYNRQMEYRRCGKTEHDDLGRLPGRTLETDRRGRAASPAREDEGWSGVGLGVRAFDKNRHDVVSRCIERGINYIDACVGPEVLAYSKALKGRRDKMYLGYSWSEKEVRSGRLDPSTNSRRASTRA